MHEYDNSQAPAVFAASWRISPKMTAQPLILSIARPKRLFWMRLRSAISRRSGDWICLFTRPGHLGNLVWPFEGARLERRGSRLFAFKKSPRPRHPGPAVFFGGVHGSRKINDRQASRREAWLGFLRHRRNGGEGGRSKLSLRFSRTGVKRRFGRWSQKPWLIL